MTRRVLEEALLVELEALREAANASIEEDASGTAVDMFSEIALATVPDLIRTVRMQRYALVIAHRAMLYHGWDKKLPDDLPPRRGPVFAREALDLVEDALAGPL